VLAIDADALSKRYGARLAVNGVSFSVERGTIFGFLGPNGSGKSTTVRMLCGLVMPTSGSARVDGRDPRRSSNALRHAIGYMAQGFALYADLTCDENLEFCARAHAMPAATARERKRLVGSLTGIERYASIRAGQLSGGWQRRLALAAALLHDPSTLFLDEPTGGVDPVARNDLWDLFDDLARDGKTLFVTTHDIGEAERCTRLGYMLDGDLLAIGTVDELRGNSGTLEAGLVSLVRRCRT
jgi:ABC-type multidrug transport system ATPase subunit